MSSSFSSHFRSIFSTVVLIRNQFSFMMLQITLPYFVYECRCKRKWILHPFISSNFCWKHYDDGKNGASLWCLLYSNWLECFRKNYSIGRFRYKNCSFKIGRVMWLSITIFYLFIRYLVIVQNEKPEFRFARFRLTQPIH